MSVIEKVKDRINEVNAGDNEAFLWKGLII